MFPDTYMYIRLLHIIVGRYKIMLKINDYTIVSDIWLLQIWFFVFIADDWEILPNCNTRGV